VTQQEIWVTVVNGTTDCTITDSFMIYVEEQAIANPVADVAVCDQLDGTNDGIANYDLTQFDAEVLGTQPQGQPGDGLFVVEYYTEDPQANPDATPIADPVNFRNETSPVDQIIYIRVYNDGTISKCSDYTSVMIHVEELPEPTLTGGTICVDYNTAEVIRTHTLDTGLDATHTFVWTFNGTPIAGATGPTYEATQAGTYNVTATSANGCISEPIADAIVLQSGPAAPIGAGYTVSNYFSDEQVITVNVEGYGTYEYSLDGGPWVESNIFTNVSAGGHTIQVRDITACSEFILTLEEVSTVDHPRYFTPNADGYHDTWNIKGLGDDNTDAKIYIFDRYGKLVKQISSQGEGWDGTMNGTMLPATDYWFKVMYRETVNGVETIKEFRAHFSLKR
jgi:gliding motility-associated-like protein